jgi:hypothetical protein
MHVSSSPQRLGSLPGKGGQLIFRGVLVLAAAFVVAVLVWQGITAKGAPDRLEAHGSNRRPRFSRRVGMHFGTLCDNGEHGCQ